MLSQLPARSVSGFFRIVMLRLAVAAGVVLMQLLGAVRTFEFMAFAGNTGKGNGQKEQREKFHRRAS